MRNYTYKDLKEDMDVNGETDFNVAFARMSVETVDSPKAEALVTESDVLSGLGMTSGSTLLAALEANLPAPVIRVIQSRGIDMANAESQSQVQVLRGTIGDDAANWLIAQAVQTKDVWPGLKPGHLQNALEGFGSIG